MRASGFGETEEYFLFASKPEPLKHGKDPVAMRKTIRDLCVMAVMGLVVLVPSAGPAAVQAQTTPLLPDLDKAFNAGSILAQDATVSLVKTNGDAAIRVETGTKESWPGVSVRAPEGKWDLSRYTYLALDVTNAGSKQATFYCRVDNPGADGVRNCETRSVNLRAGQIATIRIPLLRKLIGGDKIEFIGMRGNPPVATNLDPANVTQLLIFVNKPSKPHVFDLGDIRVGGTADKPLEAAKFFPMIDEFGQYIHREWPGKIHSVEEMVARIKAEEKELAAYPGPADRNEYGGWLAGPQLRPTGFFRVEEYRGKWWLVDPKGRLFWSHGIDCVRDGNPTPITDREHYYKDLPDPDSPLAPFYGRGFRAPHGYYSTHSPYRTYDFTCANLLRKYGQDWGRASAEIIHRRLRSWGLNTIANWSDSNIYLTRKTPYVCTVGSSARKIEGSEGYWGKFNDVFDPAFRENLRRNFSRQEGTTAGDPWCIGFFVDNELSWGDEVSLAIASLISPPDQPAKKEFVSDLKEKYGSIEKLNAAWGTEHASWEAFLESQQPPDRKKAWADLTAFYTKIAETYFSTIRDELKKVAPHQLYLGCRFAWVNNRAARAATKFCDVVSYNRYTYSVEDQRLPGDINKPIIIGEFHFGALDRGMFHTGLKEATDQQHRAELYEAYVRGALRNRYIVGTHWFQFRDQPTTGRGDGENYQIGFVDICDTPNSEIIAASRRIGNDLYTYRLNAK